MRTVLPKPSICEEKSGAFSFRDQLYLHVSADFSMPAFEARCAEWFANYTCQKGKLELIRHRETGHTAALSLQKEITLPAQKTEYEYELQIQPELVTIVYTEQVGLIHAFVSFLQLLEPYARKTGTFSVPCVRLADRPALQMRAMHLAVFPETSLTELKKAIRMCGFLKCTHMVLEFWGTLQLDCVKELAWEQAYSKREIAELVLDGEAFGIQFIPMCNSLGHAAYSRFRTGKQVLLDQAPEYEELFLESGWTWDVSKEETRALLSAVRKELMELFHAPYFHLGCDEAYAADGRWDGHQIQENRAFVSYLNDLAQDVRAHGRMPIFWGDMFLSNDTFPYPFCGNVSGHCLNCEENLKQLTPDACLVDWQYNIKEDQPESVEYFLQYRDPKKLLLASWNETDNIRGRCALARKYGLLGMIGTTWNRLQSDFSKVIVYTACQMWSEDLHYADLCGWEVLKTFAARHLSKLVPCHGNYAEAGFFPQELMPKWE